MITSYPSIYQIGHKAISDIFTTEVLIEEKIDGSQFSFKRTSETDYIAKSKGAILGGDTQALFKPAMETMVRLLPELKIGWTYRGEAICRPKHNTLQYGRTPAGGVILFDVDDGLENYLSREEKEAEAARLGLEIVPILFRGVVESFETFKSLLDRDSYLGGCRIEGFVVKNYNLFTQDKKVKMGKFVSEAFKEKHRTDWKVSNPGRADIITMLSLTYAHPNRWMKAIQHLQELGQLKDAPEDIGPLMREINADILKEETDTIKEKLFQWAWSTVSRGVTKGFPEFYKEYLAKGAFNVKTNNDEGTPRIGEDNLGQGTSETGSEESGQG